MPEKGKGFGRAGKDCGCITEVRLRVRVGSHVGRPFSSAKLKFARIYAVGNGNSLKILISTVHF